MIFDLKNEKPEILPNFKGGEKYLIAKMHFDGVNRILHGTLVPGATIGEHTHDVNSEIIYFLSGRGYMLYDGEKQPVEAGMCHCSQRLLRGLDFGVFRRGCKSIKQCPENPGH